jgi:hypothetical protein
MWGTISPKRKFHTSAEELRRMFIDDGMTISEIASKLGLHRRTVANWLRAYEIRLDPAEVRRRQTRHGSDVWNYRGYKTTSRGYIYVRRSEHPAANRDGYVLEHRLTVEAILQRYLLSGEQIHHLNFVKADNDIENLVLFPSCAVAHELPQVYGALSGRAAGYRRRPPGFLGRQSHIVRRQVVGVGGLGCL